MKGFHGSRFHGVRTATNKCIHAKTQLTRLIRRQNEWAVDALLALALHPIHDIRGRGMPQSGLRKSIDHPIAQEAVLRACEGPGAMERGYRERGPVGIWDLVAFRRAAWRVTEGRRGISVPSPTPWICAAVCCEAHTRDRRARSSRQ